MKQKVKANKGFTIVELIIVIAVIAVIAAAVVPSFARIIEKAKEFDGSVLTHNLNTLLVSYSLSDTELDENNILDFLNENDFTVSNLSLQEENLFIAFDGENGKFAFVRIDEATGEISNWIAYDQKHTESITKLTLFASNPDFILNSKYNCISPLNADNINSLLSNSNTNNEEKQITLVLEQDISSPLLIENTISTVVNLNNHTLSNGGSDFPAITLKNGAKITIEGEGSVKASGNPSSLVNAESGSTLIINGGKFILEASAEGFVSNSNITVSKIETNGFNLNDTVIIKEGSAKVVLNNVDIEKTGDVVCTENEAKFLTSLVIDGEAYADPDFPLSSDISSNKLVYFYASPSKTQTIVTSPDFEKVLYLAEGVDENLFMFIPSSENATVTKTVIESDNPSFAKKIVVTEENVGIPESAVIAVVNDRDTVYYDSLVSKLSDIASAGDKIILLKNCTLNKTLRVSVDDITIDLSGFTLTVNKINADNGLNISIQNGSLGTAISGYGNYTFTDVTILSLSISAYEPANEEKAVEPTFNFDPTDYLESGFSAVSISNGRWQAICTNE